MPRVHLMEIEDQSWCPAAIRDGGTAYLSFAMTAGKQAEKVMPRLMDWLRATGAERLVNLGTGGGGGVPQLAAAIEEAGLDAAVVMTDYYPNAEAFRDMEAATGGRAQGHAERVDARAVPEALDGARVMFNAFHHFRPEDARAILTDAHDKRAPIAVVEFVERSAPMIVGMLFTPLFVALTAPFWKPFRLTNLLFTWLIPLIPILVIWDGVVSCLRVYDPDELRGLSEGLDQDYVWEIGQTPLGGPAKATWILGRPTG